MITTPIIEKISVGVKSPVIGTGSAVDEAMGDGVIVGLGVGFGDADADAEGVGLGVFPEPEAVKAGASPA